ncbi:MAG: hypothetical protein V9H25_09330 [Candidatus Competibacter sp.]
MLAQGIASNAVTLGPGSPEPTNEQLRSNDLTDDDNDAYPDGMSNYSVDFGFFKSDFGDLPDDSGAAGSPDSPSYNTDATGTTGPSHVVIGGLRIGAAEDSELAGQPDATATGDDDGGIDDEDGGDFPGIRAGAASDR